MKIIRALVYGGIVIGSAAFWIGLFLLLSGCTHVTGDRPWYIERVEKVVEDRKEIHVRLCDSPPPTPQGVCYPVWMGSKSLKERRGKAVEVEIEEARP